ncbi:MAG: hypothetical protein COA78_29145 [Blastopirellula sp.]|nr:MAG: hypothetical protein COA78_29145 [Blastopirellula sp.]
MGRLNQWWHILLSLLVVLVPTVCVLWFMTEAVENRRLVVRRALADADYTVAQERLDNYWNLQKLEIESNWDKSEVPAIAFQRCVLQDLADCVVFYDAGGQLIYPAPAQSPFSIDEAPEVDWSSIEKLEHQQQKYEEAADAYGEIAAKHGDPTKPATFEANLAARALTGQARCLVKADRKEEAIAMLLELLNQSHYAEAIDSDGRLIVAATELRVLELVEDSSDPRFQNIVKRLTERLNDYHDPLLSSSQRLFLMKRLQETLSREIEFPTLEAEVLAAEFYEANPRPSKDGVVRLTQTPELWQLASADGRAIALFRTESVLSRSIKTISGRELKSGAIVEPVPPGESSTEDAVLHSSEAGRFLPGWRLARTLEIGMQQEPVSDTQIVAYFWTGVLVIGSMSIFALIIARSFRQQMRLTRLRNDLVATVSHELKTPLSSIRLLVDTLLDDDEFDPQKVREYLVLMAKENNRLSRLIDSFLTFSRMERNKNAFEFSKVQVSNVIDAAVEVVSERFESNHCRLEVSIEDGLPAISADEDAIVTVVLNLLDNAYKYSPDEKHIVLHAFLQNEAVCLEINDLGIGISKTALKKVFKRFYQVDYRVSRTTGGVGLGLSIVQYIIDAHNAEIDVQSTLGQGSTFTITFPKVPSE